MRTLVDWGPKANDGFGNVCDGMHILQRYPEGPLFPAEFEGKFCARDRLTKVQSDLKNLFGSQPMYADLDAEWKK